jgi:hypothetical protein
VVIFILAVSIHLLYAEDMKGQSNPNSEPSLIEKIRPQLASILGEEWTTKLIGADKTKVEEVAMPVIPKVDDNAKSTAVYDKKKDKVVLDPEIEKKYYYSYIVEVYEATRQTKPSDAEVGSMMNVLTQGGTREGVYRSFVLDSVYGGMENWEKPVKSVTADFAVHFYDKYFGKKIQKKSFEGMSIYTLKRLVTEKALETADAFGDDRDGLERWYAVMSAEFATKFPLIWTNAMRKKTSSLEHRAWASHVPLQHIKSEMIIKIHSALNTMI